ncbi:hypothetical protein PIB30_003544 [Stylosanthes scabra]|uniref:Uncharacterized protein n=1 Tax=Stylosanthes scabra TaxID=79078 RepID=A0ABU6W315_9FABA|nr:hypothetical protein [Stylosanthes scabra]
MSSSDLIMMSRVLQIMVWHAMLERCRKLHAYLTWHPMVPTQQIKHTRPAGDMCLIPTLLEPLCDVVGSRDTSASDAPHILDPSRNKIFSDLPRPSSISHTNRSPCLPCPPSMATPASRHIRRE